MEIHPIDILINIINITVLFILLRFILWKPVYRYLGARAARIGAELSGAEKTRGEAEQLKQEYARNIEGLEAQGRELMRESQTKATAEAAEIIKDAKAQAEKLLHDAHERIAEEKERAVKNAQSEVAQLATDMAARILKREVTRDDNISAAQEFFRESR